MGASPELFMRAAGMIAFTLAFALIWTPLVRRSAAIIPAAIFVAAMFEVSKVDAIGQSGLIVVLLGIAADDLRTTVRARDVVLAPGWYGAVPGGVPSLYHVGHAASFGGPGSMPVI